MPLFAFALAALLAAPVLAVLWQAAFGETHGETLAELATTVLPRMVGTTAALVAAGVRVVTCSRVRSRLEDVYNRLSEDRVN